MNKHQANLNQDNPVLTLRSDYEPAIVTKETVVSYRDFNNQLREIANILHFNGVRDIHRVLIVGNIADITKSIIWTWATMYLGASAGNADDSIGYDYIQLKAKAGNVDFIVYVSDEKITRVKENVLVSTKSHPEERFILYSSGTTKKPDNIYGVEPQFFTYHKGWAGGIAHIDCLKLAYRFLGDVPLRQLACHPWEVAYAPHNVVNCLLSGGTYYWVENESDMPDAQSEWKTNIMSNYPLAYDPVCAAGTYKGIQVIEVSGGICTPELIERIRETMNPRIISNSFISSRSGTILNRTIDHFDDPKECTWLENPQLDHNLCLRLDDSNVLWYKRDGEWMTDGDVFERRGKYFKSIGKASEEFIITGNGKISTWAVEQFANQLTRTVWGCGEHTYVFACNGFMDCNGHGLVYSGNLPINELAERMAQTPTKQMRPDIILQVNPEFWALNIKISRDRMSDRLHEFSEYIEKTFKFSSKKP